MIAAGALLVLLLFLAVCRAGSAEDDRMGADREPVYMDAEYVEETLHLQEIAAQDWPYADQALLAKIMQAESGPRWPDWAVMCIGEVVLNRVASSDWPDTIREVLYQAGPPRQYEPVWSEGWEAMEPAPEYMDLARRLLAGERPMNDPAVVWQALFPQGQRTMLTYYDKDLGTTTYFCR